MALSNNQKILIGGSIVLCIGLVLGLFFLMKKSSEKPHDKPQEKSQEKSQEKPKEKPELVPAGQLPIDGKRFVIRSLNGKYLSNATIMTDDIASAAVFTYNSKTNSTNEAISDQNTSDPDPFTKLVINFSGTNALVGALDTICKDGTVEYAIMLGSDKWNWGSVQCNVAAALAPQYLSIYGAQFYYV